MQFKSQALVLRTAAWTVTMGAHSYIYLYHGLWFKWLQSDKLFNRSSSDKSGRFFGTKVNNTLNHHFPAKRTLIESNFSISTMFQVS